MCQHFFYFFFFRLSPCPFAAFLSKHTLLREKIN